MRDQNKDDRQRAIHDAAYALLKEKGYDSASMLSIAKAAKASNETLYKWYGDKRGLFRTMVEANTRSVKSTLENATDTDEPPLITLKKFAPILLTMLMSEKAILLNRAAAADTSHTLGKLIAKGGREQIFPAIVTLVQRAMAKKKIVFETPENGARLYLDLLIGDKQIRRVIGVLPVPSKKEIQSQAATAFDQFLSLGEGT